MKHVKKALILLCVLVMAMSLLPVTSFATGTGTITIENTTKGKTYKVYKVFDATYDATDDSAASYTYTVKKEFDPWYNLVVAAESPFQLSTNTVNGTTDTYQVTLKDSKTNKDVLAWFNSLSSDDLVGVSATATGTGTGEGGSNMLKFSNLDNGYYYVTSTLGTVITLTNVNNTAEIVDKNQSPSWDKGDGEGDDAGGKFVKVKNAAGDYVTDNTAAIGDTLEYEILLNTAPNYTANGYISEYQFVDTAGAAIKENYHSMHVYVDSKQILGGYIKGVETGVTGLSATTWHAISDKTHATTQTAEPNDCMWYIENSSTNDNQFTIHIKWVDDKNEPLYPKLSASTIKITYEAVLAGNASVGETTRNNENSVTAKWLTENGGLESGRTKTTTTTTFGFSVEKKNGDNAVQQGVKFRLKKANDANFIQFYKSKAIDGKYYVVNEASEYCDDVDKTAASGTLTTNENGKFLIVGLDAGTYDLEETEALPGYNKIDGYTKITLSVPTSSSSSSSSSSSHTVADGWYSVGGESSLLQTVINYKGTVLPETGSTGTKLFILFGSIAVLGAGIFLVANKRMRKEGF